MSNKPIIVIDPGHGGAEKVGGSSPNNAVGANGLLEKNLTLDVANRVAATLAAQADVFLTRASDKNLGLSDRAKFARDKNARVFLSLHFNGFKDTNVDGTEVWVAKKATQASRDFAKTLLGRVVNATNLKDRGVREGDLGVILPARHAANTSACLLEISFLSNPAQARELEKDNYRQSIADSICDGVRQHLSLASIAQSFTYVGDFSRMLSAATPDEVAEEIGYKSHEEYVSKEIKSATLFGLTVGGGIRPDFLKKLQQAEDKAKKMIKPTPVTASDWGITGIRGYRGKEMGWHGWGLAVDIDYATNPYIMHEAGEAELDKVLAPVYRRISRLMLKRDSVIPKGITGSGKVSDTYDKLLEESNAMKDYFKCMLDQKLIQKELDRHAVSDADVWEAVWGIKDRKPSSDQMQEIMMKDYVTLAGEAGPGVSGKTYPDPKVVLKGTKVFEPKSKVDVPFDDKGNLVSRKPENGFLTLKKEIVLALTGEGLRWGAMHFGGASGDVMHFDDGNSSTNPVVSKIKTAKAALANKAASKTKTYDEPDDWGEQFEYAAPFGKTYTAADVKWAADKVSPDYRHLGAAIDYTPFDLTAANLATLCEANSFNVKSNPTDPRDAVIFALRGCCFSGGKESSGGFVSSIKLIEAIPDHQQSRCVIGVWKRSTNQIAAFLGSTVPYWANMEKFRACAEKNPRDWRTACESVMTNMLATGRYIFTVGTHRASDREHIIPGAFKQQSDVPVIRTIDNLCYETTDIWDFGNPGDNIHPSRHPNPSDRFSSEGCLTIPGGGTFMTRETKHDRLWSEFRKAAGLTPTKAPVGEDGFQFVVVLLTGREARLAGKSSKSDLTRLRFGSEGVDVKGVQLELADTNRKSPKTGKYYAGQKDGVMTMATVRAYAEWQKDQDGAADGIVTPAVGKSLGFDIINHLRLKDSAAAKSLSVEAKPRKLTDEEIRYYKNIDKTQSWKKNGKRAANNLWKDDVIWELPEKGEGFVNYNRNDLTDKPANYDDDQGLDEIGTKETVERVIAIAKEWHRLHADQPLQIGDMSRPGGIDTPDHAEHMDGKAFDMRPLRKKNGTGSLTYKSADYSLDLTKEFIRCVRLLYPKTTFLFNDDDIYQSNEFKDFVKKADGHDNHLHITLH